MITFHRNKRFGAKLEVSILKLSPFKGQKRSNKTLENLVFLKKQFEKFFDRVLIDFFTFWFVLVWFSCKPNFNLLLCMELVKTFSVVVSSPQQFSFFLDIEYFIESINSEKKILILIMDQFFSEKMILNFDWIDFFEKMILNYFFELIF